MYRGDARRAAAKANLMTGDPCSHTAIAVASNSEICENLRNLWTN
jgi:hypothetical protein